jgi:glycosyltransferase involved in cell wall biosynthesis
MTQPRPRVSIGLPIYNAERFLAECLDSFLAQTFSDFELIVSDNGSTDLTPQICREYAARDGRVRTFRSEENRGVAWNFNRVFQLSRGEYFRWAAHDDLVAPDYLARCVAALDNHPEAVWCHTRRAKIDAGGAVVADPADTPAMRAAVARVFAAERPAERLRAVLLTPGAGLDFYGVGRRDAMARTRLHRPYFSADKVFLAEFSLAGPWIEVPETLFFLRQHAEQSVRTVSQGRLEHWITGGRLPRLRVPRRVRYALGCLHVAATAPLSWRERLSCLAAWLTFATRPRKWLRLAQDALRAVGIKLRPPQDEQMPAGTAESHAGSTARATA